MRYNIPCQIDIIEILRNTFKDSTVTTNDFNFESIIGKPICINGQPVGAILKDNKYYLWLDITPEFIQIDGKWNLSALNINLQDNKESFKFRAPSVIHHTPIFVLTNDSMLFKNVPAFKDRIS